MAEGESNYYNSFIGESMADENIHLECFKQFYTKPNHVLTDEEATQVKNCAYRVKMATNFFATIYRKQYTQFEIPETGEEES